MFDNMQIVSLWHVEELARQQIAVTRKAGISHMLLNSINLYVEDQFVFCEALISLIR